jgi:hypothetical protein
MDLMDSVYEREYNEREKLVITFQLHVMDSLLMLDEKAERYVAFNSM